MLLTPRAKTGQPDLIQMLELPFSLLDGLHLVQLGLKPELKSGGDKLKEAKVLDDFHTFYNVCRLIVLIRYYFISSHMEMQNHEISS